MSKQFHRKHIRVFAWVLSIAVLTICIMAQPIRADARLVSYIFLNKYSVSMDIRDEFPLIAVSSDGSMPKFSSSRSSVASVNSLGIITAKASGKATVTVKTKKGKAACSVTVRKTVITLNESSLRLERNESFRLKAGTSNGSRAVFKSSKKSVATVTEDGIVTGHNPGSAKITVTADKTKATCKITVKKPDLSLEPESLTLFRHNHRRLLAVVSSGIRPKWRSSNSSVVTVNEFGVIAAKKHGKATITATADGVKKSCRVTVKSPDIVLDRTSIELKPGQTARLQADVSSHNKPAFKSSNSKVARVDDEGNITAVKKGSAVIRVTEDGTTAKCKVSVTK